MKQVVFTMVYCNRSVFEAGMRALYTTVDMTDVLHVLVDCKYPLRPPDLDRFMEDNDCVIVRLDVNQGLHANANAALQAMDGHLKDEDAVVFYDADEDAQQPGWFEAMRKVFAADPKCGWLSLVNPAILNHLDNVARVETSPVDGIDVRIPPYNLMNVVCGWRVGALRAVGGLTEPFKYYGGLEIAMQPKFREAGYWVGYLPQYLTNGLGHLGDQTYAQYKRRHVGFEQPRFDGSFEEWLLENPVHG